MNTLLAFLFALEIGFIPTNTQIDWVNENSIHGQTTLEAGFIICDLVYIKGTVKTFIELNENTGYSFFPHQADYSFDIGIKIDFFSIGFRHACFHPVLSNIGDRGYKGVTEEIYIRVEKKIKLF